MYRTPTIVSAHTAPYNEDEASAYAASSISARERRYGGLSPDEHSYSLHAGPLPSSIPAPDTQSYSQQHRIPQPQTAMTTHHSSHRSRPSKSWHRSSTSRSDSRTTSDGPTLAPHASSVNHSRSTPQPFAIPPDYHPSSPGLEVSPRRGRMPGAFPLADHHTGNGQTRPSNHINVRDMPQHMDPIHLRADTYGDHGYHPPSSQYPETSPAVRPEYNRGRSKSYDPVSIHSPAFNEHAARSYPAGNNIGPSNGYGGAHTNPAYATMRASPTSPTLVHPSSTQPLVVPINDGQDGWVVVPGKGQSIRLVNQKSQGYPPTSFFGRFNFKGFRSRSRNSKNFTTPVHVGNGSIQSIPFMTTGNPPPRRNRRDSY